ncbi:hypothetical protein J8TS2_38640 [Lederbergia ruris]|uniref:Uncharacterized protein n=1 Tax=Lederbergia ruris TaxID=217495 RepID=A0ABQ4KNN6_9BACI|nr:hypothetical protein [Lederbergia ruris]MBW8350576.1 hypothetical protein [Bacillus sp. IITD106]GIN59545.1 hypothetical protein J8TS2_38640 [Lederbergia ruris]
MVMDMTVTSYGERLTVALGLFKEFKGRSAVFFIRGEEVVVHMSTYTANRLKILLNQNELDDSD